MRIKVEFLSRKIFTNYKKVMHSVLKSNIGKPWYFLLNGG